MKLVLVRPKGAEKLDLTGHLNTNYGARCAALNKLGSVQRRAVILIVGGMCTSPTDMLYIHANLLLFHLLVVKVSCQSLV
jgi:hypothetical protein